jgi:hypothetical protein
MTVFTKPIAVVHLDSNVPDREKAAAVLAASEYPKFTVSSVSTLEGLNPASTPADVILFCVDDFSAANLYEQFRTLTSVYPSTPIIAVSRLRYDVDRVYNFISAGMDNVYVVGYAGVQGYTHVATFIVRALARHSRLSMAAERIAETWKILGELRADMQPVAEPLSG